MVSESSSSYSLCIICEFDTKQQKSQTIQFPLSNQLNCLTIDRFLCCCCCSFLSSTKSMYWPFASTLLWYQLLFADVFIFKSFDDCFFFEGDCSFLSIAGEWFFFLFQCNQYATWHRSFEEHADNEASNQGEIYAQTLCNKWHLIFHNAHGVCCVHHPANVAQREEYTWYWS